MENKSNKKLNNEIIDNFETVFVPLIDVKSFFVIASRYILYNTTNKKRIPSKKKRRGKKTSITKYEIDINKSILL